MLSKYSIESQSNWNTFDTLPKAKKRGGHLLFLVFCFFFCSFGSTICFFHCFSISLDFLHTLYIYIAFNDIYSTINCLNLKKLSLLRYKKQKHEAHCSNDIYIYIYNTKEQQRRDTKTLQNLHWLYENMLQFLNFTSNSSGAFSRAWRNMD